MSPSSTSLCWLLVIDSSFSPPPLSFPAGASAADAARDESVFFADSDFSAAGLLSAGGRARAGVEGPACGAACAGADVAIGFGGGGGGGDAFVGFGAFVVLVVVPDPGIAEPPEGAPASPPGILKNAGRDPGFTSSRHASLKERISSASLNGTIFPTACSSS